MVSKRLIDPADYMTPQEAAVVLGVTRQRVSALCRSGKVRTFGIGPYLFPLRADIEKYRHDPDRDTHTPARLKARRK